MAAITAREAVAKLQALKLSWRNREISAEAAELMGKTYVDIYNAKCVEVAKKYKTRARTIGYKVTDYPN